jgi:hypothetical protein
MDDPHTLFDVSGRVAIVTGSTRGREWTPHDQT